MTFINTILPKDIEAAINIPDKFLNDMVAYLRDIVVIETDGHYAITPDIKGNLTTISLHPLAIVISHEYLATLLITKYPLELMIYYQQNEHKMVNIELLHVLVYLLHRDPLFLKARHHKPIQTDGGILDDMIKVDSEATSNIPPNMYNDQKSYDTTMDILSNLAKQQ